MVNLCVGSRKEAIIESKVRASRSHVWGLRGEVINIYLSVCVRFSILRFCFARKYNFITYIESLYPLADV